MLDRFVSMAVFICVADKRSFTAAADVFGISATMVGKHIRTLEARVGAKLINRTTRQQSLTEVGRLYYDRCKQLLADADAADACAEDLRAAPRGVLKIHAPVSFGSQRLAPALADYLRRYPEVSVDLALTDRAVDLIEEGYEAAIRIGALPDSSLVARALKPYRMWLCASPAYLSESGTPRTAQDLAGHNCLGFAYWHKKDTWRLRKSGQTEHVRVRGRLNVNHGHALRTAAVAGLGIIMQPEVLVEDEIAAGRLIRLLPDYELPSRPMHVVYPADRRPTAKLQTFIEFVVGAFGEDRAASG
ncbi:LysR family transcriptional regulator [Pandoraea thiooxydans]|uniref:LysR family transcriptional regulator n=1 Tax=Pandoraea thiooxydans TaxID=445709 RepID=A0A0G3EXP8_9BURK|nr:LysR family transcriptional regulator [Pandoraea thiooxydans]AKJ70177.1 LysR family transcriptional regulator [Pandoraea thiooxydans]APR93627.1 LysR family transcriptional regulator [Pandoraea thiooxydans]